MTKNKRAGAVSAIILIITLIPFFISKTIYAAGDTTIPTLTAVVNNGMLTVDATDDSSGIAAIYINGFEFTDLNNGSITVRMQQYDTGYQYFTMQAKDGAGNLSEVYRVNNPYYTFPDEDNGTEDPSLPSDVVPTDPSKAEADVTDHVKTDKEGNTTDSRSSSSSTKSSSSSVRYGSGSSSSSSSSVKQKAVEEFDEEDDDYEINSARYISSEGREFYTIMTKTGKVFYLVIDRTEDEETVHFLTDITENDLLNVTEDNKPSLPQNSAVVIKDAGLEAGSGRDGKDKTGEDKGASLSSNSVSEDSLLMDDAELFGEETSNSEELTGLQSFIKKYGSLIGILCLCLVALIIYEIVRFIKRNGDDDYIEDEESEDDNYDDVSGSYDETDDEETFMDRVARESEEAESDAQADQPYETSGESTEERSLPDNVATAVSSDNTENAGEAQAKDPQQQPINSADEPARPVYQPYSDTSPQIQTTKETTETPDQNPVYMPFRTAQPEATPDAHQVDLPSPRPSSDVIYEDPEEEEPEEDEDER